MHTYRLKSSRPARPAANGNQRAFTLIEMVVGLAIMAVLVSALATGITQAFRAAYFQRTGAVSVDEARRIIPIITKDLMTAKSTSGSVTLNQDNPGAVFTITFEDPEDVLDPPTPLDIVYELVESNLIRSEDNVERTIGRHVREVVFTITDPGIVEATLATWTEENTETATDNSWTVYQRPSP